MNIAASELVQSRANKPFVSSEIPPDSLELTIIMPCLNEVNTLARCIDNAFSSLKTLAIDGEVLVADNGSTDGSVELARQMGARVISVSKKGYGSALKAGIAAARGKYVLMGDADDSYDFGCIEGFVAKLRQGYELVMGNRFSGGIDPGAMPFLHRYLGNPVLSYIGRILHGTSVRDFHCGLRACRRESVIKLNLVCDGMEFASEMVVKSAIQGLRVTEVPTVLRRDGRGRPPHLNTWRDGWRHLKFLFLFSPQWLFLYPGLLLAVISGLFFAAVLPGPSTIGKIEFDIHTLLYGAIGLVVGLQMIFFSIIQAVVGSNKAVINRPSWVTVMIGILSFERMLVWGGVCILGGIFLSVLSLLGWGANDFGAMDPALLMRCVIPSALLIMIGFQCICSGGILACIDIYHRDGSAKI